MSMAPGFALTTGATGTGFTVTATGVEVTVSDALSVTWSSKDQTPVVAREPVDTVGLDEVVHENELPKSSKFPPAEASSSH
jgi:hypothetical protein